MGLERKSQYFWIPPWVCHLQVDLDSSCPSPRYKSSLTEPSISGRKLEGPIDWKNSLTSNPSEPLLRGFFFFSLNTFDFLAPLLPLNVFLPQLVNIVTLFLSILVCPALLFSSFYLCPDISLFCIFLSVHSPHSGCPGPWPCVHRSQLRSWWPHAACPHCGTWNTNTHMKRQPGGLQFPANCGHEDLCPAVSLCWCEDTLFVLQFNARLMRSCEYHGIC